MSRYNKYASPRVQAIGASVWAEFAALNRVYTPINLGQGQPNYEAEPFVKDALVEAANENENQYCRFQGHTLLCDALVKRFSPIMDRELDPSTDIMIGTGAAQVLYLIMQAYVSAGDEVLILEPYFDFYPKEVELAGATPVFVSLDPPADGTSHWTLDVEKLRKAVTPKTKMLMINTPYNPLGKVFSRQELEDICAVVRENDLLLVSDEVYEVMVYDKNEHVKPATLDGMWERTITVGSGGKTFSVTGWKIGWAIAPANLILPLTMVLQFVNYSTNTPCQYALARAFERASDNGYWESFPKQLERKRDKLCATLTQAGIPHVVPEGSFFLVADFSSLDVAPVDDEALDFTIAKFIITKIGVSAIPMSAFYAKDSALRANGCHFIRFCFAKTDETLDSACERLLQLAEFKKKE